MKKIVQKFFVAAWLLMATALPALADDQLAGTLLGAGVGGAIGNSIGQGPGRVVATAGGVVVGGYIGNQLTAPSSYGYASGRYPSQYARGDMFGRSGYSTDYPYDMFPRFNDDPGYQANFVAQPDPQGPPPVTYVDAQSGNFCRQFSELVRVGDRVEEDYGTACLRRDGSWHIVNN